MVDGKDALGSRFACHPPGLLRSAVEANPWIVGADRHDREVCAANLAEPAAVGRVAAEKDAMLSRVDQVTGIAPVRIRTEACTPVIHLQTANARGADPRFLAPPELM